MKNDTDQTSERRTKALPLGVLGALGRDNLETLERNIAAGYAAAHAGALASGMEIAASVCDRDGYQEAAGAIRKEIAVLRSIGVCK